MSKIKTIILIQFLLLASCNNENNSFSNTSTHNESTSSESVCANNCITDLKGNVFSEDELNSQYSFKYNTGFSSLADYISYSNIRYKKGFLSFYYGYGGNWEQDNKYANANVGAYLTVGLYNYKSYGDAVCYETYYIEKLADYFTTDNTARYACFNDLNSVEGFPSSPIRDNNYIIYKNKGIINLPLSKIEEALNAEHTGAITIGVNVFYFNKYLHQKEDGEIVETTTYDDGNQKYNINHFEVKLDGNNEISIDENYYNCD